MKTQPLCNAIVVLYSGATVAQARVVGATSDPDVVHVVAQALLRPRVVPADPVIAELDKGAARAAKRCAREAQAALAERGDE